MAEAAGGAELPLGPLMADLRGESLTAGEADFLRHPALGAVILFAHNYRSKAQAGALVAEIKALRSPPLLVAVDQEGGAVQRFTDGFYPLPAAARIGELHHRDRGLGLKAAGAAGQLMAAEVAQTGVDLSFAPVLDCRNPHSCVIGQRAFHPDPGAVFELAGAYITGMRRAGMAATAKHFPGHGGVDADSRRKLPVDSRTLSEIQQRDILPFARLAARLGGVMTAHIQFPRIDRRVPAYSRVWLREILRGRLGFDGVIFSDDLSMAGAANTGDDAAADMPTRCIAALNAGCDMALVCNDPDGARRAADALGDGYACDQERLLAMRIDQTAATPDEVERVAAALAEFHLPDTPPSPRPSPTRRGSAISGDGVSLSPRERDKG
ncbi:MAG: beta-N-acetylhexosaminidase [Gammaproteobacteria bacterium]|nr:beta-N-acetylhexosaminidase [Gammaproteobacteria bacterium]